MTVPARISLTTLGVTDICRATEFYQRLGWELSPASVSGVVSFFRTSGSILAVWGRAELAADAAVDDPVTTVSPESHTRSTSRTPPRSMPRWPTRSPPVRHS